MEKEERMTDYVYVPDWDEHVEVLERDSEGNVKVESNDQPEGYYWLLPDEWREA